MTHLEAWAVDGVGEVTAQTDLGALVAGLDLLDGDIVLLTSKVVSKAEGRVRAGRPRGGDRRRDGAGGGAPRAHLDRREPSRPGDGGRGGGRVQRGRRPRRAAAEGPRRVGAHHPRARVRRDGPQRGRPGHRHRRPGLAHRPDRPGDRRRRAGAARRVLRPHRLLRQRAGGHRSGRRRRAGLAGRAGHGQARRPTRLRRPRARGTRPPRRRHGPGAGVLIRPRELDMFALGAREAVLAAVRGDQADCFGSPASAEEVHAALASCGLAGTIAGLSVRVALPTDPATRSPPSSGCASSRTRTGGVHRATRLPGTPSPFHRLLIRRPRSVVPGTRRRRTMAKKNERENRASCDCRAAAQAAATQGAHAQLRHPRCVHRRRDRPARGRGLEVLPGPAGQEGSRRHSPGRARCDEGRSEVRPGQDGRRQGLGQHINAPQKIPYDQAPPSYGAHWPNFLQGSEIRTFYTPSDRPEIERLVHSLEHGHTILWYDET